jgi:hypothetical protein
MTKLRIIRARFVQNEQVVFPVEWVKVIMAPQHVPRYSFHRNQSLCTLPRSPTRVTQSLMPCAMQWMFYVISISVATINGNRSGFRKCLGL